MKKYFLQFYREEDFLFGNERFINFNNGLSYVWNQVKEQGEIVWREIDDFSNPITEGQIYASVWYTKTFRLLYSWARQFPKLEVFVCGPLVLHYGAKLGKDLSNFHIINKNAEDLFCNGKVSDWNLEIINTDKPIGYSVALVDGYGCYWGNCRYCKIVGKLKYREVDKVPILEHPNRKYIWLHVYSIPPFFMKKLYPQFEDRDDIVYGTYIRGDKESTIALKETLPKLSVNPKHLAFDLGIEYPSDKMLQYMNKGSTVKDYLDFIKISADNNIRLHFNFILGWKLTDYDDLDSMEYFLNQLSKISKPNTISINIYPLTLMMDRKIISDYTMDEIEPFESDYDIFIGSPKQTEKQKEINSKIKDALHAYPFLKVHDVYNIDSTWRRDNCGMVDEK